MTQMHNIKDNLLLRMLVLAGYLQLARSIPVIHPQTDSTHVASPKTTDAEDQDVKQLVALKSMGRHSGNVPSLPLALYHSKLTQTSGAINSGGASEAQSHTSEQISNAATGSLLAGFRHDQITDRKSMNDVPKTVQHTVVDVPSENIHRETLRGNGLKRPIGRKIPGPGRDSNRAKKSDNFVSAFEDPSYYNGLQYTPEDMAKYIFKTGDNGGVTLAVEELVKQGLLSRYDAMTYLEDVKLELQYLMTSTRQMEQLAPAGDDQLLVWNGAISGPLTSGRPKSTGADTKLLSMDGGRFNVGSHYYLPAINQYQTVAQLPSSTYDYQPGQLNADQQQLLSLVTGPGDSFGAGQDSNTNDPDTSSRAKMAELLYNEYSLEEVIYELAKQMFIQSIARGSDDAEKALQRFSEFLRKETVSGRISEPLERKVLDVMMAALVDAIAEHPDAVIEQPTIVLPPSDQIISQNINHNAFGGDTSVNGMFYGDSLPKGSIRLEPTPELIGMDDVRPDGAALAKIKLQVDKEKAMAAAQAAEQLTTMAKSNSQQKDKQNKKQKNKKKPNKGGANSTDSSAAKQKPVYVKVKLTTEAPTVERKAN